MKRDLKRLNSETYDLLIVGAGIYGATLAWDAALRGLKVALIDRGDFGAATSANSLKTIHGGLRYLQQLDLARMRESIRERQVLMRIAPHLVHPLPVLMPTYGFKLKSRPAMMAAMIANDIVGFDRNRLADPQKYVPNGRTMSSRKLKELIPEYDKHNLNGGALWFDCQCHNTERLLLAYVISAADRGADVANYVRATGLLMRGDRVIGVHAEDTLNDERFDIRAAMVANESGPWTDQLMADVSPGKSRFLHSTALNLVIDRPIADRFALGLSGPFRHVFANGSVYNGFRVLFFAPWRGRTIIGTDHRPWSGDWAGFRANEKQIQQFLADINQAYPAAGITRQQVTFFNGGFLPMSGLNPRTGEVRLLRHYRIFDHEKEDGIAGILSVIGVKYTTARDVAARTIDRLASRMGRTFPQGRTATIRLHGGEIDRFTDFIAAGVRKAPQGLDERVMRHLGYNYGSALDLILDYGKNDRQWLKKISSSDEVLRAEIVHGVRQEMAQHLADVVLRRTDLGSAGSPGQAALEDTARIMAGELDWSDSRCRDEIEAVKRTYVPD